MRVLETTAEKLNAESLRLGVSPGIVVDQLARSIDQSGEPQMTIDQFTVLLSRTLIGHRLVAVDRPVIEQPVAQLVAAARVVVGRCLRVKDGYPDVGGINGLAAALELYDAAYPQGA